MIIPPPQTEYFIYPFIFLNGVYAHIYFVYSLCELR